MKDKIINLIEELIKEHIESEYCTDYEDALNELDPQTSVMYAYDAGRYEALTNLLDQIKTVEE